MRLHIEHSTSYTYRRPVTFHRHRLVLRPRETHDLRLEQMRLTLSPAYRLRWIQDVFGNSVTLVDWMEPADRLTIVNELVVDRTAPFPSTEPGEPWQVPFPPQYDSLEISMTSVYAVPSYSDDVPAVRAWLREALTVDAVDAEASMLALCRLVHRTCRYQRRTEKGVQTPAATLGRRSGSCRDLATLMMDAARVLGVAARFVSGYLHGSASMAGNASTHAWTEVYLPTLGWRGFDPTIGGVTSLHHITTGVSSHPRGVMPISGSFTGAAGDYECMQVSVRTRTLDGPAQDAIRS
jgi:transglutaminase-like putative cysteine protease